MISNELALILVLIIAVSVWSAAHLAHREVRRMISMMHENRRWHEEWLRRWNELVAEVKATFGKNGK